MRRVLVALVAVTFIALAFTGCLGDSSPQGFNANDLRSPKIEYVTWGPASAPTPRSYTTITNPWTVEWQIADIYAGYGGVLLFYANNTGAHTIYIYGIGLRWDNTTLSYERDAGAYVAPGEKVFIGLLPFKAPTDAGTYHYSLYAKVAIESLAGNSWYDKGEYRVAGHGAEVIGTYPAGSWSNATNPSDYYDKVNQRVQYSVTSYIAQDIEAQYPGNYSILQVAAAYEWVRTHITYKEEPPGQDYWQSASETLSWGTGDCEDFAILLASLVGELGGQARLDIIEGHAFATVFLTSNASQLGAYWDALDSYYWVGYGILTYNFLKDERGYWLVADAVGYPYLGGLPAESRFAEPVGGQASWSFESTSYLYMIDATGHTASTGWFGKL